MMRVERDRVITFNDGLRVRVPSLAPAGVAQWVERVPNTLKLIRITGVRSSTAEQLPFKQLVAGSNPAALTNFQNNNQGA